jgi:hypothetical protein
MQKIIFTLLFVLTILSARSQITIVSVSPDTICTGTTVTVTIHFGPDRSIFTDSLSLSGYVFPPDTFKYTPYLTGYILPDSLSFYFDSTMLNQDRAITFISNNIIDTGKFYLIDSTHYRNTSSFSGLNIWSANQYNSDTVPVAQNWFKPHLIVDSFISMCANSTINLTASGPTHQGLYFWTYPFHNDTAFSKTVTVIGDSLLPYPYTNVYHCTYIDTSKHCGSATGTTYILVKQTPIQYICVVTLDSTLSYNMLVWDKAQPTDTVSNALIDSFLIMRGSQQIASQPYAAYSTYTDYNADISLQAWTYSITVVDVCGLQTPSYYVSGITTMFQEQPNNGDVTWYPYMEGSNAISTTYSVLREAGGSSTWTLLDTVTAVSSPITIHDTSSVITPGTKYRVEAAGASCVARSAYMIYSNIATFEPNGINQIGSDMLEVYPNPTDGLIHLSRSNLHIVLSDLAGQKVDEIFNSGNTLDISWLTPGVYFLSTENIIVKVVKL